MLFYNFTTLDDFIKNDLITNIEEEKNKQKNTLDLYSSKKNNLLNVTTNMIAATNTVDKTKVNQFHDTVLLLKSSFEEFEKIESFAQDLLNRLEKITILYSKDVTTNYNEIKAELIDYNKKSDELYNLIINFEKDMSNILDSAIDLSNINSDTKNTTSSNEDLKILTHLHLLKDNDTLIISEKDQLAYLPYKYLELEKIYKNSNGKYSSIQDVIDNLYVLPLGKFKNSSISRFRESFNLVKNKENSSMVKALELGLELMFKYNLNPIIIAACRNLDELDIYLDCLESNELHKFKCFEIKFEVAPQVNKNIKENLFGI